MRKRIGSQRELRESKSKSESKKKTKVGRDERRKTLEIGTGGEGNPVSKH